MTCKYKQEKNTLPSTEEGVDLSAMLSMIITNE